MHRRVEVERNESNRPATGDLGITLLGGFAVNVNERTIADADWDLRKAKSLIKLLALHNGHSLHREQIMLMLWPDLDSASGSNNLHKAVHVARRALQPDLPPKETSAYLHSRGEFLALEPPGKLLVDVESFREAATRAREAQDPQLYESALALYTGDLLPGDVYEDWCSLRREQLKDLRVQMMMELAGLQEAAGRSETAVDVLRELIAIDPSHEEATLRLMRLLVKSGHRHLALRQYHVLRDALHEELDAEPSDAVKQVYQQILTGRASSQESSQDFVPWGAASARTEVPESPLIGRETELGYLKSTVGSLRDTGLKVGILSGEAGIGKTRLSTELAAAVGREGTIVIWCAAPSKDPGGPYELFIQGFEDMALRTAVAGPRTRIGASPTQITSAVAELHSAHDGAALDIKTAHSPWRLAGVLSDCLRQLARYNPVLLVLDDLALADEPSSFLLDYLIGNLRALPILFLGCIRSEGSPSNRVLESLLNRLGEDGEVDRVDLHRLPRQDADKLVEKILSAPADRLLLDLVYRAAGGNPYFTREAVNALKGRMAIRQRQHRWYVDQPDVSWLTRDSLRRPDLGLAS